MRRRWTAEDRIRLRAMALSGASLVSIAAALGRTALGVKARAQRDGVHIEPAARQRAWSAGDVATLRRMASEGRTLAEAAAATGRMYNAAHNAAARRGIFFRGRAGKAAGVSCCSWDPSDEGLLRQLAAAGTPWEDIALRLGRTVCAVMTRHRRLSSGQGYEHAGRGGPPPPYRPARARTRPWTERERELAIHLHRRGRPIRSIARALARPVEQVSSAVAD